MPYLGNQAVSGENNSFRTLDDISSYTLTFDGSSASVVSTTNNTITQSNHRFVQGQRVTYTTSGSAIGNLTSGGIYYIIKVDINTIKLASSAINASNLVPITLSSLGSGTTHNLNAAFDGVNTKFLATYDNGNKCQLTRAAQLQISINGVIQQPKESTNPVDGFGIDVDSSIIFSSAPVSTDVFWGNVLANNFPTFDIADNTIDTFTGNGSQTVYALSKTPANNQNVLVTVNGVVQYPSDNVTVRAYNVSENVIAFTGAPGSGSVIQVRHIGFAGATSSSVTGFYGRIGNVGLTTADNVTVGSIGIATNSLTNPALTGVGNSFKGLYISNGMIIHDNSLSGNNYIGTAYNGLMAGPVAILGSLTVDGSFVVV